MKARSALRGAAMMVAVAAMAVILAGCHGIPVGTLSTTTVGSVNLQATGAGIVAADAQTVTYKIKCGLCGYEPEAIRIPVPEPGKPYTIKWVCPRCGHKQTVVITAGS